MAKLNPYLNFNGKCCEAMTFYRDCLGGELTMQRISESSMAAHLPSAAGSAILFSKLSSGNLLLMGSDLIGSPLLCGNTITLCVSCSSDEEINRIFQSLSKGGEVKLPLHQTFWGCTYGELTDKFGIGWMVNLETV